MTTLRRILKLSEQEELNRQNREKDELEQILKQTEFEVEDCSYVDSNDSTPQKEYNYVPGDFVKVDSGNRSHPFIARLLKIYEDSAEMQWFYRPTELQRKPMNIKPNEIFFYPFADINPLNSIIEGVHIKFTGPDGSSFVTPLSNDPIGTDVERKVLISYYCQRERNEEGFAAPLSQEHFLQLRGKPNVTINTNTSPVSALITKPSDVSSITPTVILPSLSKIVANVKEKPIVKKLGRPRKHSLNHQVKQPVLIEKPSPPTESPLVAVRSAHKKPRIKRCGLDMTIKLLTDDNDNNLETQLRNKKMIQHNDTKVPDNNERKSILQMHICNNNIAETQAIIVNAVDNIVTTPKSDTKELKPLVNKETEEGNLKASLDLEHAFVCTGCPRLECKLARSALQHVMYNKCTKPRCETCVKFRSIAELHEIGCQSGCVYPKCKYFSDTITHGITKGGLDERCDRCWFYQLLQDLHGQKCTKFAVSGKCNFPHY